MDRHKLVNVFSIYYCTQYNKFVIAHQDGTTIAPSRCPVAIQGLFGGNDTCSNIAQQLITSGGDTSNGDMPDTACLARLLEFANSCNMSFVSSVVYC